MLRSLVASLAEQTLARDRFEAVIVDNGYDSRRDPLSGAFSFGLREKLGSDGFLRHRI